MHNFTFYNQSNRTDVPSEAQFFEWFCAAVDHQWHESEVELMLVTVEFMSDINQKTRNKTGPTNTLAFPFDETCKDTPLFGEIIMCPQVIEEQAQTQGIDPIAHYAHLTVHSTLHLMGYDHQLKSEAQIMEQREISTLKQLGFANPYSTEQEQQQ